MYPLAGQIAYVAQAAAQAPSQELSALVDTGFCHASVAATQHRLQQGMVFGSNAGQPESGMACSRGNILRLENPYPIGYDTYGKREQFCLNIFLSRLAVICSHSLVHTTRINKVLYFLYVYTQILYAITIFNMYIRIFFNIFLYIFIFKYIYIYIYIYTQVLLSWYWILSL